MPTAPPGRPPRVLGPPRVVAAIAATVVIVGTFVAPVAGAQDDPAAPAAADEVLEVRRIESSGQILVAVPGAIAGRTLPADAFRAATGGGDAAQVAARRVADRDLDLTIVVDFGGSPTVLGLVQGALVELVLRLPASARVRIVDGGTTGELTTDRQLSLDELAALHTSTGRPDDLDARLADGAAGRRHAVLVVTDRPDVDVHPPAGGAGIILHGVSLVSAPDASGRLEVASRATGGQVFDVSASGTFLEGVLDETASGTVLEAVDAVADDLYRLYEVDVPPAVVADAGAQLSVSGPVGTWSTGLVLAADPAITTPTVEAAAPAEPVTGSSSTPYKLALLLGVGVVALIALAAAGARSAKAKSHAHPGWRAAHELEPDDPKVAGSLGSSEVMHAELRTLDTIDAVADWRSRAPVRVSAELYNAIDAGAGLTDPDRDMFTAVTDALLARAVVAREVGDIVPMATAPSSLPSSLPSATPGLAEVADRLAAAIRRGGHPDLSSLAQWTRVAGRMDVVIPLGVLPRSVAEADLSHITTLRLLEAVATAASGMLEAEQRVVAIRERYLVALDRASGPRAPLVVDVIVNSTLVSLQDVQDATGVSHQGARNQLNRMAGRGWLVEVGRFGRGGRKYWLADEVVRSVLEIVEAPALDAMQEVGRDATT